MFSSLPSPCLLPSLMSLKRNSTRPTHGAQKPWCATQARHGGTRRARSNVTRRAVYAGWPRSQRSDRRASRHRMFLRSALPPVQNTSPVVRRHVFGLTRCVCWSGSRGWTSQHLRGEEGEKKAVTHKPPFSLPLARQGCPLKCSTLGHFFCKDDVLWALVMLT